MATTPSLKLHDLVEFFGVAMLDSSDWRFRIFPQEIQLHRGGHVDEVGGGTGEQTGDRHDTARVVADADRNVLEGRFLSNRRVEAPPAENGEIDFGPGVHGLSAISS